MELALECDRERGVVRVRLTGDANSADCANAIRTVVSDPQFDASYSVLADIRDMSYYPSSSDIEQLAHLLCGLRDCFKGRIALIVPNKLLLLAAKLACAFTAPSGITMKPFMAEVDAVEWCTAVAVDT